MNSQCVGFILIAVASLVHAEDRSTASIYESSKTPVVEYRYGMKLDIAKVMGITSPSNQCGVVPAIMTYLDHAGERHSVGYQTFGNDCHEN
ncbi:MAG: hypothetical protein JWP80_992 [Pseudomonas sp.]|nr:hypothetical protein [Pseudomonas sp.]